MGLLLAAVIVTVVRPARSIDGDSRVYVEAAHSVTHAEYRAGSEPNGVPRYPPGFPILLVPFVAAAGDDGARAASIVIGGGLVVLVWLAAGRLGGPRAAAVAALVWALSPLVRDYSTEVMSDPAGAAMVVLALLAVLTERWLWASLALGWSCWIRLIHVTFLPGLGRRRSAWMAAVAVLVPLALFQLATYGRLAGYDGGQAQFSVSNIFDRTPLLFMDRPSPWPNWQFFPGMLWGLRGGMVPLLVLFAGFELVVRRAEPGARFAAWVILTNVAVYLPYFFQAARFVLPAACLVIVFGACGVLRVIDEVIAARRSPAVAC